MRRNSRKYGVYSESDNCHEGKPYHFLKTYWVVSMFHKNSNIFRHYCSLAIITAVVMKKYSMLYGGLLIILVNIYGLCITFIFRPIAPAVLASSLIVILAILYIELNKRRVLLDCCKRQSYAMVVLIAIC